ncbi:sulfite exporter TauE/SafE family protein [Desertibaculum subflavum]|uniref:sulfite exporter TauE/SafE family protein n=1 Tax=Desertibaculum subflavum TaxID=2268458 RepID=UPI000E6755BF
MQLSADLVWLGLTLVVTGAVTGLLAGLLGVGGGIIIVPVIIEIHRRHGMDIPTATLFAIGTSQAAMVAASVLAALAHRRGLGIDREVLRAWTAPVLAGAVAGVAAAPFVPATLLILIFVSVALAMSLQLGTGGRWMLRGGLARGVAGAPVPFLVGGLSAALGLGAGTLGVPALTFYGVPLRRSVGAASVLAAMVATVAMAGFIAAGWSAPAAAAGALGYVEILPAAILTVGALALAPIGARLANHLPVRRLQVAFALILVVVAARMLWLAFAH